MWSSNINACYYISLRKLYLSHKLFSLSPSASPCRVRVACCRSQSRPPRYFLALARSAGRGGSWHGTEYDISISNIYIYISYCLLLLLNTGYLSLLILWTQLPSVPNHDFWQAGKVNIEDRWPSMGSFYGYQILITIYYFWWELFNIDWWIINRCWQTVQPTF